MEELILERMKRSFEDSNLPICRFSPSKREPSIATVTTIVGKKEDTNNGPLILETQAIGATINPEANTPCNI